MPRICRVKFIEPKTKHRRSIVDATCPLTKKEIETIWWTASELEKIKMRNKFLARVMFSLSSRGTKKVGQQLTNMEDSFRGLERFVIRRLNDHQRHAKCKRSLKKTFTCIQDALAMAELDAKRAAKIHECDEELKNLLDMPRYACNPCKGILKHDAVMVR